MPLTHIRIENFKSIKRCDLDLCNLNTLTGANGTGKTNILDALNYFYNLHLAQLKNREIKTHEIKTKVVTIPVPSVTRAPIKLFNLNEVEDEDING